MIRRHKLEIKMLLLIGLGIDRWPAGHTERPGTQGQRQKMTGRLMPLLCPENYPVRFRGWGVGGEAVLTGELRLADTSSVRSQRW